MGVWIKKQRSTPAFPRAGGSAMNTATHRPLQSPCPGAPRVPAPCTHSPRDSSSSHGDRSRCRFCLTLVVFLGEEMTTHSSTLAWKIPWTGESGGLWSMGVAKSQTRLSDFTFLFTLISLWLHCFLPLGFRANF